MANTDPQNEIDLIELFKGFVRFFEKIFSFLAKLCLHSFFFIVQYFWILLLSIVLGVLLSFVLVRTAEPIYYGDFVLRNNTVAVSELSGHINRLSKQASSGWRDELLAELVLEATNDDLFDISGNWVVDLANDGIPDFVDFDNSHNPADTMNIIMRDRLAIRIIGSDYSRFYAYRDKIVNFVNEHEPFITQNRIRILQSTERLGRISLDIDQLDSLQKVKYFEETRSFISNPGQILVAQDNNTQLLHGNILDLYDLKFGVEKNIKIYPETVTIISDLVVSLRINSLLYYLFRLVLLSIGVTLIILLAVKYYPFIKKAYRKYKLT